MKLGVLHKPKEREEEDPFELFPQGSGPCQTDWWITKNPSTISTKSGAPVPYPQWHENDVILGSMASQITSLIIVYSAVIRAQTKNIKAPRRWPLCGEFTGPVTRKMFLFDDVFKRTLNHGACDRHHPPWMTWRIMQMDALCKRNWSPLQRSAKIINSIIARMQPSWIRYFDEGWEA